MRWLAAWLVLGASIACSGADAPVDPDTGEQQGGTTPSGTGDADDGDDDASDPDDEPQDDGLLPPIDTPGLDGGDDGAEEGDHAGADGDDEAGSDGLNGESDGADDHGADSSGGGDNSDASDPAPPTAPMNGLYTAMVTHVDIEVDYETGAAPYTGSVLLFGDLWDLFETNLEALFAAHPKTLTVDRDVSDMQQLPGQNDDNYTVSDILSLAGTYRDGVDSSMLRTFYIIFLDGYFHDGTTRRTTVLGVSIGSTGVVAMFKPVIAGTGTLSSRVEQTTLVHEFGHAAGLVNNGVDAIDAAHHDTAHGAHCSNDDCVMYWLNNDSGQVVDYVTQNVLGSQTVLFDQDCLDDVAAAANP